ncbi:MAG: rRNA maturation RNase YbeY [Alphaproteobacteria bacterium]|nr:rRNA maturation RNase YbeY [Alphaproteobacteria bacterium]
MPEIDVQVRNYRYYLKKIGIKRFCQDVVLAAWQGYEPAEVSVVLADDDFVHGLNRDYRGQDKPTNVLSFENAEKPPKGQPWMAGDIIIAYQTVCREASDQGKTFLAHLAHLLIHGALHLQGYDHLTAAQAKPMERLEIKIMKKLGYKNPYLNVES